MQIAFSCVACPPWCGATAVLLPQLTAALQKTTARELIFDLPGEYEIVDPDLPPAAATGNSMLAPVTETLSSCIVA